VVPPQPVTVMALLYFLLVENKISHAKYELVAAFNFIILLRNLGPVACKLKEVGT
jgi:hypothetical protein